MKSVDYTAGLVDYYNTFLDVLNFSEETLKVLSEFAQSTLDLKVHLNVCACACVNRSI